MMLWFCDIEPRNKRTGKQTIDELNDKKGINTALFYMMRTLEKNYVYSLQTKHNENMERYVNLYLACVLGRSYQTVPL